jgi:predicted GIY-YIG superfamily endonuclease
VATSTANNQEKRIYIGITEGDFKTRYRNHTKSFRHEEYKTTPNCPSIRLETEVRKQSVHNKVVHYEESQSIQTRM